MLKLQLLNQENTGSIGGNADKDMQYSCYVHGLKRHFKTIGLSAKQFAKVEKMIDQSDNKRTDVKRIHVKYTKDQTFGYKLEKMGNL